MGITKEQWGKFAEGLIKRYWNEQAKLAIVRVDEFAREVTELYGGFSTWRVSEMKKSGMLYGYLYKYDDLTYVVTTPEAPPPKKKR